jgi:putative transposase
LTREKSGVLYSMYLCHKIRLAPNNTQLKYLRGCAGVYRMTWNWINEQFIDFQKQRKENDHSGFLNLLLIEKEFNAYKHQEFPFLGEYPKDCNLSAFKDFSKTLSLLYKGKVKEPRFKSLHNTKRSFTITNLQYRIVNRHLRIRKRNIKMMEDIRLPGKVKTLRIVEDAPDQWYVCFFIETETLKKPRYNNDTIGVDVGIKTLIHTSNNVQINYPNRLKKLYTRTAKQQRKISNTQQQSRGRLNAKQALQKTWNKIKNIRNDLLHKTTTQLCKDNQFIVIEDLNVSGMVKNKNLACSIQKSCWSDFRRKIEYKAKIWNNTVIVADRFYPSSKTCSVCKTRKDLLKLSDRMFKCESCGSCMDRDLNASLNLKNLVNTVDYTEIKAPGSLVEWDERRNGNDIITI